MKNIVLSILLMSACAMIYAQADSSPYQAIVAVDGSGDYKTVQEAINAVGSIYIQLIPVPKNSQFPLDTDGKSPQ